MIYRYDGTFDGILCCVFKSYQEKEIPEDIILSETTVLPLLPVISIKTEQDKAERVAKSIPEKMGYEVNSFVRRAFMTCLPSKEIYILLFLRLGYRYGANVMRMLTNDIVHTLFKAVRHLDRESHLFKGFIRFSIHEGVLISEIEPKNFVLPMLAKHFCDRYPEGKFLIYDKVHKMGLIYEPYRVEIISIEKLVLPEVDEEERKMRDLWKLFFETIEIEGRHNPRCQRTMMPKHYWGCMTEFQIK